MRSALTRKYIRFRNLLRHNTSLENFRFYETICEYFQRIVEKLDKRNTLQCRALRNITKRFFLSYPILPHLI